MEYDSSIFRVFELRKTNRVYINKFSRVSINNMYSVFNYYRRYDVLSVRFRDGVRDYLPQSLVRAIATGELPDITDNGGQVITNVLGVTYPLDNKTFDEADNIIVKYMHDKIDSIYSINIDDLEEFVYFQASWENFVKIPLLLYAMKGYYKLFTQKQSNN